MGYWADGMPEIRIDKKTYEIMKIQQKNSQNTSKKSWHSKQQIPEKLSEAFVINDEGDF